MEQLGYWILDNPYWNGLINKREVRKQTKGVRLSREEEIGN